MIQQNFCVEVFCDIIFWSFLIGSVLQKMYIISDTNKYQNSSLIIIFGAPGSGKTTLAQTIYQQIYKNYNSYDQISHDVMIISADSCQQFLRHHDQVQLKQLLNSKASYRIFCENRIQRKAFDQSNWKRSRQFIKKNTQAWLNTHKIVIIEDDMLLRSQRKYFRHIAEQLKAKYLQIMIERTYEQCLQNVTIRQKGLIHSQQKISLQVLKKSFEKLQVQKNQYLYILGVDQKLTWDIIQINLKKIIVQHPQFSSKTKQTLQNPVKIDQEVRIRKFISEIIRRKQLQLKYCHNKAPQSIPAYLSLMKKKYHQKIKSLQGFMEFLIDETMKAQKL